MAARVGKYPDDVAKVYGEEVKVEGLSSWLEDIDAHGYVVIPNWVGPERVAQLRSDLEREVNPVRELLPPEKKTVRAHNLLGKTRCVDDLVCDMRLLALVQGVLGHQFQVSVVVMFDLLPGAKPQYLHQDDGLWPLPRPHPPFVCNAVIAVDDFSRENGATIVVPGSHRWHDRKVRQPPKVRTKQVEMPSGSMLVWTGALWHGGGGNESHDRSRLSVNINFNLSYLRQQENQYIGVPWEEVMKMPERLRRVLGYQPGLVPSGPGMVDLRDPYEMMRLRQEGRSIRDINHPLMPKL